MDPIHLLVIAPDDAPWLSPLSDLPADTVVYRALNGPDLVSAAAQADVVLNCTGSGEPLEAIWPRSPRVRWIHSLAAGVEKQLIPELVGSDIPLTNSRGVYKESLGEFVLGSTLFFAKDFRRMLRQQAEAKWEPFDVDEISRQTMGIVGYGEIGAACAQRAKAFGMTVYAMRRRPELSAGDSLVDRVFPPERLREMIGMSDYVVVAAALTPQTRGLVGREEIAAMRPDAVIMNVGRGPVIDEAALVDALKARRIRGAALDVFDTEPLPRDHPFWTLDNVLLSPHCADHTHGWLESAVEFFVANFKRFRNGEPLLNVVNKEAGY